MSSRVTVTIELPEDLGRLLLPLGVRRRLDHLLDKQDRGQMLTVDELAEAEGLADLNDVLSLLRLRADTTPLQR